LQVVATAAPDTILTRKAESDVVFLREVHREVQPKTSEGRSAMHARRASAVMDARPKYGPFRLTSADRSHDRHGSQRVEIEANVGSQAIGSQQNGGEGVSQPRLMRSVPRLSVDSM
jgi:hypothetical protein